MKTQLKLFRMNYRTLSLSVPDFLAKVSVWLENDWDLKMIQEELYSLRLPELLKGKEFLISSSKMYPDCYRITKARRLKLSSFHWKSWGTMLNGLYLTAQISVCRKKGNACSLWQVLVENASAKYHLSIAAMLKLSGKLWEVLRGKESTIQAELPVLNVQVPEAGAEKQDSTS